MIPPIDRAVLGAAGLDPNPRGHDGRPGEDLASFLSRRTSRAVTYGSGKVALRDGLAGLTDRGTAVVLPAYVPDALVEPVEELGYEARFHAVRPSLAPAFGDLRRRLDGDVAAVVSVNYFGFPAPGFARTAALAADCGAVHVEDNAHGALSVADGDLLGTRGDLGITSLRKALPVPDGALLYLPNRDVARSAAVSSHAGTREHLCRDDLQFLVRTALSGPPGRTGRVRRLLGTVGGERAVPSPARRYERSKRRQSLLTARLVRAADPAAIRRRRRTNFRRWLAALPRDGELSFPYTGVPPGVSPQVLPVRSAHPRHLRRALERAGLDGVHTWPRLPAAVEADPTYDQARALASQVLVLPVHQHLDPALVDRVGRAGVGCATPERGVYPPARRKGRHVPCDTAGGTDHV